MSEPLSFAALRKEIYKRFRPTIAPTDKRKNPKTAPWGKRAFVNPLNALDEWMKRAIVEISAGRCDVAAFVVPAWTESDWWHEYVLGGAQEIYFVRGSVHPWPESVERVAVAIVIFHGAPMTNEPLLGSWNGR